MNERLHLLFHGDLAFGGQSLQRCEALERNPEVEVIRSAYAPEAPGMLKSLLRRISWRLRWPIDSSGENAQLLRLAREHRPEVVFVYNSRLIRRSTLRRIRVETGATLVYFSPDDVIAPHNMTGWLRGTFREWDLFYTSKTFNVAELRTAGVKQPVLTGNVFSPELHRPMTAEEIGEAYESFDLVFVGTFEADRETSLRKLARAGFSVLVHGNAAGLLHGGWERLSRAGVTIRPAANGLDYSRVVHHAKVPLGFLRKINRDEITHRSVELPAMGRAMLAEKTAEHDRHLRDGEEYVGFASDDEMIAKARELVADKALRARVGQAGRARCFESGYDVDSAMAEIVSDIRRVMAGEKIVSS